MVSTRLFQPPTSYGALGGSIPIHDLARIQVPSRAAYVCLCMRLSSRVRSWCLEKKELDLVNACSIAHHQHTHRDTYESPSLYCIWSSRAKSAPQQASPITDRQLSGDSCSDSSDEELQRGEEQLKVVRHFGQLGRLP
eukprot:6127325-Amphidinium_carterae.1